MIDGEATRTFLKMLIVIISFLALLECMGILGRREHPEDKCCGVLSEGEEELRRCPNAESCSRFVENANGNEELCAAIVFNKENGECKYFLEGR